MKIFRKAKARITGLLRSIGELINATPSKEDNLKVRQSPLMRSHIWEKKSGKKDFQMRQKAIKGKKHTHPRGKPDIATEVFNHPREDSRS